MPSAEFPVPFYRRPSNLICSRPAAVTPAVFPTEARSAASSAGARSCPITIAPRSRTARSTDGARDLLAEGSDRCFLHPDPGLGARAARGRHDAARQLRCPQRTSLYAGRPHPDRARHRAARRNVDGPHPPMDAGQSGGGQGAPAAEQVLRVLPRDRAVATRTRRSARRAFRSPPGRSIAVDRALHVYGTPFFIEAELPIDSRAPTTKFRRLMIAQDTGSAIVGPGARRSLFRRRRGGRPRRRPHPPSGPLRHAGAARARPGRGRRQRCRCRRASRRFPRPRRSAARARSAAAAEARGPSAGDDRAQAASAG